MNAHAAGINLAFFGASGILRHVRLEPSMLGPDRQEVDYRDSAEDPLNGIGDPLQVTGNTWASPPANWPEDTFVGESYNGFLAAHAGPGALRVTDSTVWIFAGTGLHDGQEIPGVTGSDVDGDALSYSITAGNTAGAFAINLNTGAITVANPAALDFGTSQTFNLTVTDDPAIALSSRAVTVSGTGGADQFAFVAGSRWWQL